MFADVDTSVEPQKVSQISYINSFLNFSQSIKCGYWLKELNYKLQMYEFKIKFFTNGDAKPSYMKNLMSKILHKYSHSF